MARFLIAVYIMVYGAHPTVHAKDLGVHGVMFSLEEEDLLQYILKRINSLSDEEIDAIQEKVKDDMVKSLTEPKPIEAIKETTKFRRFQFDPTVCLKEDITDHNGKIIVKKSTAFNPMQKVSLTGDLIFFDATQESHVEWAKSQNGNSTWVLVRGKPLELEEVEGRPVFFDQYGVITKKLGILNVPARIYQEGQKLTIEEIPIEDGKCEQS